MKKKAVSRSSLARLPHQALQAAPIAASEAKPKLSLLDQ